MGHILELMLFFGLAVCYAILLHLPILVVPFMLWVKTPPRLFFLVLRSGELNLSFLMIGTMKALPPFV